jgi:hypothetical protein
MSVWTTTSTGRDRDYIVLKHTLRGVNYVINGVKFRNSYAVVEKNSKTYRDLKRIPVLKAAAEHPLTFLRKLPFITRPLDVKIVYGAEVFAQYLKDLDKELNKEAVEKKVEQEIKHVVEEKLCSYKTVKNELCKEKCLEQSPSGYCMRHILEEPRLLELGIEVPKFIPKKEKWEMKQKVAEDLASLKKEGKF